MIILRISFKRLFSEPWSITCSSASKAACQTQMYLVEQSIRRCQVIR